MCPFLHKTPWFGCHESGRRLRCPLARVRADIERRALLDKLRGQVDVDGDGREDALSDGLMLIRYLFGLRGPSLISGAIGPEATRTTAHAIETYIRSLMP